MKDWGSLSVTNVLLLIIAVLLLVLVVNSSPRSSHPSTAGGLSQMGPAPSSPHDNMMVNPHDHEHDDDGSSQGSAPAFNFQNMAFAALKCPTDATVSLADIGCKGPKAKEIRDYVMSLTSQNLPPRMLFDKVIEKFGEGALTDEALEIRKNNRK